MRKIIKFLLLLSIIGLSYITIKDPTMISRMQDKIAGSIKNEVESNKSKITVYYKTADSYVVPLTRIVSSEEAKFDNVINLMTDNEENGEVASKNGLFPTVIAGSIKSVKLEDNTAKVDLSEKAQFVDEEDEKAFIISIVYALTEFENVDSVSFEMGDKETLTYGSEMNKLYYRENINEIEKNKNSKSKHTMYIAKKCENVYNYIPYSVYTDKSDLSLKHILINHFTICNTKKYSSMIFATTANIEDVIVKGESVYIHLSKEFSLMDKTMLSLYKNSVALTVKENSDDIKKVRFVIDQNDNKDGIIETELVNDYSNEERQ